MKKLMVAVMAAATMGAFAEENKEAELEKNEAPLFWGFGNAGLYSGYCLYGSLVNNEPTFQMYAEANMNLSIKDIDCGYLGLSVWGNADLTHRRGNGNPGFANGQGRNLVGGFNEWDPQVHWGKTFWFDDDRAWGLDYRTWVVWYWYPPHDGYGHTHTTWDWDHTFALVNPYVTPYVTWVREYSKGANLIEFGLRRPTVIESVEGLTLTPSLNFVWREAQYNWCFPTGFGSCSNCNSGLATLRLQLDATYQFSDNFGVFAKVAYCSVIDPDLRNNIEDELDAAAYGAHKDFVWGGIGLSFNF